MNLPAVALTVSSLSVHSVHKQIFKNTILTALRPVKTPVGIERDKNESYSKGVRN